MSYYYGLFPKTRFSKNQVLVERSPSGEGGLMFNFARRDRDDGLGFVPINTRDQTAQWSPCCSAHSWLGCAKNACVPSPRDGTVSVSSHLQQNLVLFSCLFLVDWPLLKTQTTTPRLSSFKCCCPCAAFRGATASDISGSHDGNCGLENTAQKFSENMLLGEEVRGRYWYVSGYRCLQSHHTCTLKNVRSARSSAPARATF